MAFKTWSYRKDGRQIASQGYTHVVVINRAPDTIVSRHKSRQGAIRKQGSYGAVRVLRDTEYN